MGEAVVDQAVAQLERALDRLCAAAGRAEAAVGSASAALDKADAADQAAAQGPASQAWLLKVPLSRCGAQLRPGLPCNAGVRAAGAAQGREHRCSAGAADPWPGRGARQAGPGAGPAAAEDSAAAGRSGICPCRLRGRSLGGWHHRTGRGVRAAGRPADSSPGAGERTSERPCCASTPGTDLCERLQRLLDSHTAAWQQRLRRARQLREHLLLHQARHSRQADCVAALGACLGTCTAALQAATQDVHAVAESAHVRWGQRGKGRQLAVTGRQLLTITFS